MAACCLDSQTERWMSQGIMGRMRSVNLISSQLILLACVRIFWVWALMISVRASSREFLCCPSRLVLVTFSLFQISLLRFLGLRSWLGFYRIAAQCLRVSSLLRQRMSRSLMILMSAFSSFSPPSSIWQCSILLKNRSRGLYIQSSLRMFFMFLSVVLPQQKILKDLLKAFSITSNSSLMFTNSSFILRYSSRNIIFWMQKMRRRAPSEQEMGKASRSAMSSREPAGRQAMTRGSQMQRQKNSQKSSRFLQREMGMSSILELMQQLQSSKLWQVGRMSMQLQSVSPSSKMQELEGDRLVMVVLQQIMRSLSTWMPLYFWCSRSAIVRISSNSPFITFTLRLFLKNRPRLRLASLTISQSSSSISPNSETIFTSSVMNCFRCFSWFFFRVIGIISFHLLPSRAFFSLLKLSLMSMMSCYENFLTCSLMTLCLISWQAWVALAMWSSGGGCGECERVDGGWVTNSSSASGDLKSSSSECMAPIMWIIVRLGVLFKQLFYRYIMNDRELRRKKTSQPSIKIAPQKHPLPHYKSGPACKPKQPPNISNYYNDENKRKDHTRDIHSSELTVDLPHTHTLANSRVPRISHGKLNDDTHVKRKLKDGSLHFKVQRTRKPQRQNRELRSNIDLNRSRQEKLGRTEVIQSTGDSLFCGEKLIRKKGSKVQERTCKARTMERKPNSLLVSSQKTRKKTYAEQIADFEASTLDIAAENETEALTQLFFKEQLYSRIKGYNCYLVDRQKDISWFRRAIVINWMMEICQGFGCKRETFALAVNYLDRYLTLADPIPLSELQRIACGALSLSNKVEGPVFTIRALVDEIEAIEVHDVTEIEQKILKQLEWKLHPPTGNMWANRIALQWDMYLDHQECLAEILQLNLGCIKFKTMDIEGYNNFRSLMQFVDFALMDVHTLQYHSREMAASFIYILLCMKLRLFTETQVTEIFPKTSQYILKSDSFNEFYCEFLKNSFGFTLQDLLPTVQYCSTFAFLPLSFELPPAVEGIQEEEELDFSEFCSFQTHNQQYLPCLKKRNRLFD